MERRDYLIVGAGMTAASAVSGIRELDARGTIALVGSDPHAPYNRPPLSKGLWKGEAPDSIWRPLDREGLELHTGRRVTAIDPARRRAEVDGVGVIEYGKLLLATGGEPRRLAGAPEGVIHFRTWDDYQRTRALADRGARFVVVGGGFIGSEVAAALRLHDCPVTMVIPERGIAARVFPSALSTFVADYYRGKGATVHLEDAVERIEARGAELVVHTRRAGEIVADAVVAGLGITLNTGLATQAGLTVDDGIVVDDRCRASHPDIYAAGDVARFPNPALGKRIRVEHEDNANSMGAAAGRNMAGADRPYDHLPFFYSDLFDLGYEAVGEVDARHETVADWKEEFREGVVYYLEGGRVRGVLLWNTWGQLEAARALIAEPGPTRPEELAGRIGGT
jgi:3-phenylpropionate/trans-cinnamate dioxygenase ferredoxin reductase component